MRKFIFGILILLILFVTTGFAQQQEKDSLLKIIATSKNDSLILAAHNKLCRNAAQANPDEGIKYGIQGVEKVKNTKFPVWEGSLYQSISLCYDYKNYLDSCLYFLNKAIDIFKQYKRLANQSHAVADIAFAYYLRGNYESALKYHLQSLDLRRQVGDLKFITVSLESIGMVYRAKKDYKKAIEYYKQAIEINSQTQNKTGLMSNYINLASAFQSNKQYDSTYYYSKKSLELAINKKRKIDILSSRINIATALTGMKKNEEALTALKEIEADSLLKKDKSNYLIFLHTMSQCYLHLKDYDNSVSYGLKGLTLSKSLGRKEVTMGIYDKLAKAYYAQEKYKEAYDCNDSVKTISDKILNLENIRNMNEMTVVYETVEKTKEIDRLVVDNSHKAIEIASKKRERNYFILSSVLFLALSVVAFTAYSTNKKQKEKLNEQNKIIAKSLEEKEVLLREIHHRVKNNLQIVSSLLSLQSNYIQDEKALSAVMEGKNRVESMGLIHQNLYQEENLAVVDIQSYISNLCDNLFASYNIQSDKIILKKDIQKINIDVDTVIPLGLMINELITNCLKYAFEKIEGQGV
ncbi:MAG: tetratricopeptide repeat protein, partial [Bacteroidetes bacterium]|nr:tetratricopeptide repeat protein [Bacteroidota bacterium]